MSLRSALAGLLLMLAASNAWAQSRPVRVLVGLPPGGGVEAVSRIFAEKLRETLGQPFVIENRVGGSGLIAMEALRTAAPDGHTLLFAPSGGVTLIAQTFRKPRFDPFKDVVPVAMVGTIDVVLVANAATGLSTLAEYLAAVKSDTRLRNFGAAPGTIPHLAAATFADAAGIDPLHVPYKGAGQVITDVLGGVLAVSVVTAGEAMGHQRAGRLRIVASFGATRSPLMPDVPTMKESGYAVESGGWFGFYAPAGTPPDVIDRYGRALVAATAAPDVRERLERFGVQAIGKGSAEVAAIMRADYEMWGRAIRVAKLELQD